MGGNNQIQRFSSNCKVGERCNKMNSVQLEYLRRKGLLLYQNLGCTVIIKDGIEKEVTGAVGYWRILRKWQIGFEVSQMEAFAASQY